MSKQAVARRYANALSQLAAERDVLEPVGESLKTFAALLASSDALRAGLSSPAFSSVERKGVLEAVLSRWDGLDELSGNFIRLLGDKGRMAAFDEVVAAYQEFVDERMGRARAHVTSATTLSAADLATIEEQIKKLTGKAEVLVEQTVDPALIGGIVTRVGDLVFDGSIRTRLQKLRLQLINQVEAAEA
jgi:F-type H+-transporting ATPase subunit delta